VRVESFFSAVLYSAANIMFEAIRNYICPLQCFVFTSSDAKINIGIQNYLDLDFVRRWIKYKKKQNKKAIIFSVKRHRQNRLQSNIGMKTTRSLFGKEGLETV
jgi:hypothetical protein